MSIISGATVPTPADLRAELGRANIQRYVIAGRIEIAPHILGQYLNGVVPMPDGMAQRIQHEITLRCQEASK